MATPPLPFAPLVVSLTLLLFLMGCQDEPSTVFSRIAPESTGVNFANQTGENDSFNILTHEYVYNGGGVGIGDFDRDGRQDLFFTGCEASNELYLNRGDFNFERVTDIARVGGGTRWNNGVTVADVNGDGLKDVYVCATTRAEAANRANQLFINQGNNPAGIPTFSDEAPAYGIADTSHNTQAAWLDYDGDGDLDLFLLVNRMVDNKRPNDFSKKAKDGTGIRTDKLYRQDRDGERITFTEVGPETGILYQGFALAVTVCDLNDDGWPDLYISNDYLSNDLIYLNTERAGKRYFEEVSANITKHTSFSAMGNDVADLNNDGLPDIIAVDMLPADNLRRKMMLAPNNYTYLINLRRFGYQPQFTRNTLQLSQGLRTDSLTDIPYYAEVAMQSGLPATDWSWTPLVADFNLDGKKDVIITNGFPRDITDKDFGDYNLANNRFFAPADLLNKIPSVKIPNVAYKSIGISDGIPQFEDVSADWGIDVNSFSNGAAYADLDNDGDLDYIVNNIYDPAHIYRNNTIIGDDEGLDTPSPDLLWISFSSELSDAQSFGTSVWINQGDEQQYYYLHPHRGYLSSHQHTFPVPAITGVESKVLVRWPGGDLRSYGPFAVGDTILLSPAAGSFYTAPASAPKKLLTPLASPDFVHREYDFVDFNVQPMLLQKFSQLGPGAAVSDINGDGYDDLYVTGGRRYTGTFLYGSPTGLNSAPQLIEEANSDVEELGALFFDADGDEDKDLYVVSGGNEFHLTQGAYDDRIYENTGGRYTRVPSALPKGESRSGSVVRAFDYDQDGDLDLFVGTRLEPFNYPKATRSIFLRNDSSPGNIQFFLDKERTDEIASLGNVSDALFSDYDNDGDQDLIAVGDWSPIRIFQNTDGHFTETTSEAGLQEDLGWWTSLTPGDLDADGDMDYVVGNVGHNTLLRPSREQPVTAILSDIDDNGGLDFIPFTYLRDSLGNKTAYPYFGRNDFGKQVTKIKSQYTTHRSYADAPASTYLTNIPEQDRYKVTTGSSTILVNEGGRFTLQPLPESAQSSPLFGAITIDVNSDGLLDIIGVGNDASTETSQGYMDAGNGIVLLNKGDLNFQSLPAEASGWSVPGQGRALVLMKMGEDYQLVALQNSGPIITVSLPAGATVSVPGSKTERYWGSGYLSQGTRR